jgi:cytochrome c553
MNKGSLLLAILLMAPLCRVEAQDVHLGERLVRERCIACHGMNGNSPISPEYPRLAGQHQDYLEKALSDYIVGQRKDPTMRAQVVDPATGRPLLSDDDIQSIAGYFARQRGLKIK